MKSVCRTGRLIFKRTYCILQILVLMIGTYIGIAWANIIKILTPPNINSQQNSLMNRTNCGPNVYASTYKDNLQDELDTLRILYKDSQDEIKALKDTLTRDLGRHIDRTTKSRYTRSNEKPKAAILQKIFDDEWRCAMDVFERDEQIKGIKFLSDILKDCQIFCKETAANQLANFINPFDKRVHFEINQVIPDDQDLHDLYKVRNKASLHTSVKESLHKSFEQRLLESTYFEPIATKHYTDRGKSEDLEKFIRQCCDLCWQCAIAQPQIMLKFGVEGKHFEDIKNDFLEYCDEISYSCAPEQSGKENTVMQVVWPACFMLDSKKETQLLKGTVVLYSSN